MTNGDEVMFPSYAANQYVKQGLTKREYFAATALSGLLANYEELRDGDNTLAVTAVRLADRLIAALNQENK